MLRELFEAHLFKSDTGLFKHAASSSAALPFFGVDESVAVTIETSEGFGCHCRWIAAAPSATAAVILAVRWSAPGLAVCRLTIV